MLLSTILTDEDQILENYQEAIDTFKIVLEQSEGMCLFSSVSLLVR